MNNYLNYGSVWYLCYDASAQTAPRGPELPEGLDGLDLRGQSDAAVHSHLLININFHYA
jgi:hypothetical protein